MRPRTFDEFVGQGHVASPDRVLRRSIEADSLPSLIFWGPPGSGKTTLAELIAATTKSKFISLTATSAGVADLRRAVETATKLQSFNGQRTVLFIDEIHRFNKAQQDTILPHVENGTITLIGATTENPSFEVNAALLSRCRVFRLEKLSPDDIAEVLCRALADQDRGLGGLPIQFEDDALRRLVELADGDARIALNGLELAVTAADGTAESRLLSVADIEDALQQPALLYDKAGDMHYHVISAFIKSIRGSDPDAAVYWLARMLEAGEDPLFVVRRMVILAAEDIGLADPQALLLAVACQQAVHFIGMPEGYLPMTECAIYLATAPKSNSALTAYKEVQSDVLATLNQPVPLHLRNATTGLNRTFGFGEGYRYAHDYDGHYVDQQYLPDMLVGKRYYDPTDEGAEASTRLRLAEQRGNSQ